MTILTAPTRLKPVLLQRAVLGAIAVCLCTPSAAQDALRPDEVRAICDLTRNMTPHQFVSLWERTGSLAARDKLIPGVSAVELKRLPHALKCGREVRRLHPGGYGEFIDNFGLSKDGSIAVVDGGVQRAPLDGRGGVCYFLKRAGAWVRVACESTWVS